MKRTWFTQQKPYDYMPLRFGLGLVSCEEFNGWLADRMRTTPIGVSRPTFTRFCSKTFTTRTRKMSGEYYVVEGSRFKAVPVEPRIEFRVLRVEKLNLRNMEWSDGNPVMRPNTFAEYDLGYRGATFDQLRDELLKLNPSATIDTPFYVHSLAPISEIA